MVLATGGSPKLNMPELAAYITWRHAARRHMIQPSSASNAGSNLTRPTCDAVYVTPACSEPTAPHHTDHDLIVTPA